MDRRFASLGALAGLLTVALGAFGAHALREHLTDEALGWWQTAVLYQGWHALALLAVASLSARGPSRALAWAGWSFAAGIVLFSGSLYALALTGQRGLGLLTPVGGLGLLAGWGALLLAVRRGP